ncbi:hypothetical protein U1Q18_007028 [Sarracenia purpurea var. burkii]
MAGVQVKQELIEELNHPRAERNTQPSKPIFVIDLSSSGSDSDDSSDSSSSSDDSGSVLSFDGKRSRVSSGAEDGLAKKTERKKTRKQLDSVLPPGFLDPLPPKYVASQLAKQFWKARDFEGAPGGDWDTSSGNIR